jgi:hypothetical protein
LCEAIELVVGHHGPPAARLDCGPSASAAGACRGLAAPGDVHRSRPAIAAR